MQEDVSMILKSSDPSLGFLCVKTQKSALQDTAGTRWGLGEEGKQGLYQGFSAIQWQPSEPAAALMCKARVQEGRGREGVEKEKGLSRPVDLKVELALEPR